ncbi:MAG TPA: hypothetical protein VE819_06295 [Steroidobacteraceae bacterium]|jgi:hypothetical protein|nr:hypothetical protein [Steroidobacteraceae bacterium]
MKHARIHETRRCSRALYVVLVIMLGVPCLLAAQEPPAPTAVPPGARAIPRPEELEPGVNTTPSSSAAPAPTAKGASPAAPVAMPAPAASTASAAPATPAVPAPKAAPAAGGAKTSAARENATTAKATARKGADRLELDATDITGNRELPKVLYIVPWKRSDLGDVVGKPANSLLDEVLQPLDRDVFRRENRYYDALQPGAGDAKAGTAQGSPNKP